MALHKLLRLLAPVDDLGADGAGKVVERETKADFGDEPIDLDEDELDTDAGDKGDVVEEEDLEDDDDSPAGKADKTKPIPGKRAAEMVAKAEEKARKAMQSQLDELKRQLAAVAGKGDQRATPVQQLKLMQEKSDELEDAYNEAVFAGKKEEARAIRLQQRQLDARISDYKVELRSIGAQRGAAEDVRFQVQLDIVETRYPELNPDHEDFDSGKADEVSTLIDGLVAKGTAKDVALKRAVKYVLGERRDPKAGDEDPAQTRALQARKRAADASLRTPPKTGDVGRTTDGKERDGVDLSKRVGPQTFAKYAKLDEREKSKLRGDVN